MKQNLPKCPFCNARSKDSEYATVGYWICGTYLDSYDENGEALYKTGKDCDLACFRNCVIRQASLLGEVLLYPDVQIPKELLKAIEDEISPNK